MLRRLVSPRGPHALRSQLTRNQAPPAFTQALGGWAGSKLERVEDKKMRETFVRRLQEGKFAVPPGRAADFVAALTPSWVGFPRGDTSWDDTPPP